MLTVTEIRAHWRNNWFDWRRRETQLQLACRKAEEFGTAEEVGAIYAQLNEVYGELPKLMWLWVNFWYENRRSFIRVRNRRRAGVRHVVRTEGWHR